MRIVGLLRGINVGKSVKVPMKELKDLVEGAGCTKVVTYLNSGNVVFSSALSLKKLRSTIEDALERRYGQRIPLLLLSGSAVRSIRDAIPAGWENSEAEQTYVAYLFPEADRPGLVDELPVQRAFIAFKYVPQALVWNIKRADLNRSRITKIVSHPAYAQMTTRNVNTARKLAELCEG